MLAATDRFFADTDAYLAAGAARLAELDRLGAKDREWHERDDRTAENTRKAAARCRKVSGPTVQRVAEAFGVTPEDILGRSYGPGTNLCMARHVAMYLVYNTGLSLPETGRVLGGKNQATVYSAVHKIARMRAKDRKLDALLKELEGRP